MKMNMNIIYNTFGYNDMAGLAESILNRIDLDDLKEDAYGALFQAMDEGMIYTEDQWTMIEYYCTPSDANYNTAWEMFESDLMACINAGVIEIEEEGEEEEA